VCGLGGGGDGQGPIRTPRLGNGNSSTASATAVQMQVIKGDRGDLSNITIFQVCESQGGTTTAGAEVRSYGRFAALHTVEDWPGMYVVVDKESQSTSILFCSL